MLLRRADAFFLGEAEAVHRLRHGESYGLPEHLWGPQWRFRQRPRWTTPMIEVLEPWLDRMESLVPVEWVYEKLKLDASRHNAYVAEKVRKSMEALGWHKAKRRIDGRMRRSRRSRLRQAGSERWGPRISRWVVERTFSSQPRWA
jgi:hypothetical protein